MSAKSGFTALIQVFGLPLIGGIAGIAGLAIASSTKGGDAPAGAQAVQAAAPAPKADADDLNARARLAERRVIDTEKEIVGLLKEVNERVSEIKPGDFEKEKMTIDAFRQLLPRLKAQARWIIDKKVELEAHGQRLSSSLDGASAAFLDLVPLWQRFAAEEADPTLKSNYAATAKSFEGLAAEMARRRKEFETGATGLKAKLHFVERSHTFLDRVEKVLPVLGNPATAGTELQTYMTQVKQYMEAFEATVRAFQEMEKKMQRGPGGDKPVAKAGDKKPGD